MLDTTGYNKRESTKRKLSYPQDIKKNLQVKIRFWTDVAKLKERLKKLTFAKARQKRKFCHWSPPSSCWPDCWCRASTRKSSKNCIYAVTMGFSQKKNDMSFSKNRGLKYYDQLWHTCYNRKLLTSQREY